MPHTVGRKTYEIVQHLSTCNMIFPPGARGEAKKEQIFAISQSRLIPARFATAQLKGGLTPITNIEYSPPLP